VNKTIIVLFVLVVIATIGAAGYFGFSSAKQPDPTPTPQTVSVTTCDVEQTVTAPGNLVNVNIADVKMPATGKLSAINARLGDSVKAGQILADIDPVAKTQAQVNLLEAQDALEKAQKNRTVLDYPRATDAFLKDLRKRITNAKKVVSELESNYKNEDDPLLRGQILASLTTAKEDLSNLQSNMNWYTSKPTENDITNADSELALTQAKYDAAKAVLESLEIKAPFNGIVFAVDAQIGETYQAETTLFTVGDPKALEVVANVTEEDYPLLSVGQTVEIYFDAQPDANVQGKVERIIPQRIEGDHPLYNIYITLDNIPDGLADGMTADTAITIAQRAGVLCLPRAVVRASSGDTTTVKLWDDTQEISKQIRIGLRGDTYIEIVSGLNEGDQVVTR
jgi:multidrug efflux pump subunit AcrA (membrane-fusion protein)